MSNTVALTIYTSPYPSITNNIEVRIYKQSDDLAIVASLNHAAPHGDDTWSFPGLERTNYLFRIFEMSGSTIIQQLGGDVDVVPGAAGSVSYRPTEQVAADVTTGFSSGVNTITFDGTSGRPDWRGWDIDTIDRIGIGPMKRGIDFSYNATTGALVLLQAGDIFGSSEYFNTEFAPQISDPTESVPVSIPLFSTPQIITSNYSVNAGSDMGGLLIVDPSGNYLEITLPDIATVVAGKLLTIEMRRASTNKCAKILTASGQTIDWLAGARTNLYICPQESISIYKFIDPSGPTSMWRVFNPYGNWLKLGEQVAADNLAANVFNKKLLDGSILDTFQFARLYNDFVLQLPAGEVVNYDDWATGNNKYKYSLANSPNLGNANKFLLPDRRGLFERITDGTRLPGDWQGGQVGQFNYTIPYTKGASYTGGPNNDIFGNGFSGSQIKNLTGTFNSGIETRPANIAIRKFILV